MAMEEVEVGISWTGAGWLLSPSINQAKHLELRMEIEANRPAGSCGYTVTVVTPRIIG